MPWFLDYYKLTELFRKREIAHHFGFGEHKLIAFLLTAEEVFSGKTLDGGRAFIE
jgi:hypothetical protein